MRYLYFNTLTILVIVGITKTIKEPYVWIVNGLMSKV